MAPREALDVDRVVRAVYVRVVVAGDGLVGKGGGEAGVVPAGVVGAGVAALRGGLVGVREWSMGYGMEEEMGTRRTGVSIAQGIPAYSSMSALRKSFRSSSM